MTALPSLYYYYQFYYHYHNYLLVNALYLLFKDLSLPSTENVCMLSTSLISPSLSSFPSSPHYPTVYRVRIAFLLLCIPSVEFILASTYISVHLQFTVNTIQCIDEWQQQHHQQQPNTQYTYNVTLRGVVLVTETVRNSKYYIF